MKDKKKLSIILAVVGVALIIFGIILSFISNVKKDALAKRIFFNMYQCQYRWSAILTFQAQALLLPFLRLLQMLSRKFRFSYECV